MTNKGHDEYGDFIIVKHHCSRCGELGPCIRYNPDTFSLPLDIDVEKTILKSPMNYLGISCGCYSTFSRQIAHIEDYYKNKKVKEDLQAIISDQSIEIMNLTAQVSEGEPIHD